MVILSAIGMEKLRQIQDKYSFMSEFELEQHDIYEFCTRLREAYHIGLCLDDADLKFIEEILKKMDN